jgi:hypothetical protein
MPFFNLGTTRLRTPSLPGIPILGGIFGSTWPWQIDNLDKPSSETIVGDFFPESLVWTVSTNYASATSLNRNRPITQWSHGNPDKITFNALLFARHFRDNLLERAGEILLLTERDRELNRPPVVLFNAGPLSMRGVVTKLGGIRVSEVRNDGSLRSIEFSITIQQYSPFSVEDIEQSTPGTPEPSTLFKLAKQGDTFEQMAKREYGDPMKGVHLRSTNTFEVGLELEVGEEVKLLPANNSQIKAVVAPVSSQISRGQESEIQSLFDKRSGSRLSFVG